MLDLARLLSRSAELHDSMVGVLGDDYSIYDDGTPRFDLAFDSCQVAWEHATAVQLLIAHELATPAIALIRLQYESTLRAAWLLYAASPDQLAKLATPLDKDAEEAASKLPGAKQMLEAIGRASAEGRAPVSAHAMLAAIRETNWDTLNSYVHGGIHPIQRAASGYPDAMIDQVVRMSNGVFTISGVLMAILSGQQERIAKVSAIQRDFADCLPPLLRN